LTMKCVKILDIGNRPDSHRSQTITAYNDLESDTTSKRVAFGDEIDSFPAKFEERRGRTRNRVDRRPHAVDPLAETPGGVSLRKLPSRASPTTQTTAVAGGSFAGGNAAPRSRLNATGRQLRLCDRLQRRPQHRHLFVGAAAGIGRTEVAH
jgi:hypothetical protein